MSLFFGAGSLHGSFDLPSILFGLAVILLASALAGSLATAFSSEGHPLRGRRGTVLARNDQTGFEAAPEDSQH